MDSMFSMDEYCYNTSWHSSTKSTPFEAVYGRPPPALTFYKLGTTKEASMDEELRQRDQRLAQLQVYIFKTQQRMKIIYDKRRRDR